MHYGSYIASNIVSLFLLLNLFIHSHQNVKKICVFQYFRFLHQCGIGRSWNWNLRFFPTKLENVIYNDFYPFHVSLVYDCENWSDTRI